MPHDAKADMLARPLNDLIVVLEYGTMAGEDFLIVSSLDYEAFAKLPDCVEFLSEVYVKTGWNSDVGRAYYKVGGLKAKKL